MARESCRIAPPSGLRVNRKSAVPVHVQLMSQLRHLISTGALKPGMQLPTVRQLAGFLRINPNTVSRALADLERDGYVEGQQGRGTFVSDRPTREGRAAHSLERLVGESLTRARQLGFTQDEFLAALASSGPTGQEGKALRQRAALVECNDAELRRYRDELEAELPLQVDRMLVDEFESKMTRDPGFLKTYRVVITTFFHVHEVKRHLPLDAPPVVALLAEASIKTLLRLTELPEGSTVGLVCTTATGGQNLLRSVQSAGLMHITPVLASTDDAWSLDRMLERTRTVVCSEQAAAIIRPRLPHDVELIVADRTLDRGGIELLRDLLLEPETEPAHRG
jgi:GntR family transcriptional regulator